MPIIYCSDIECEFCQKKRNSKNFHHCISEEVTVDQKGVCLTATATTEDFEENPDPLAEGEERQVIKLREIECRNKNCEFFEDHPCIVYKVEGMDCWDIESGWVCPLCKGKKVCPVCDAEWTCPVCKNKPRENRFSRLQTEIE